MSLPSANTLNHPDWIRAVSAQVSESHVAQWPTSGAPRLETVWVKRAWPVPHYDSLVTSLTSSGLPFLTQDCSQADLAALLDKAGSPVIFRNMPAEHAATKMLLAAAHTQMKIKNWERATLDVSGRFESWLQSNFDQKRRKELKRLRARLAEQGNLSFKSLESEADVQPFIQAFLELEQASWKGARGTAIADSPAMTKALMTGLTAIHQRGGLRFWMMQLDGKPVAALFAIVDNGLATLGKIAHDEGWSKYSPGVLMILEATSALFAEQGIVYADSNAIPNHPMINRIWRDRLTCFDMVVGGRQVAAWRVKGVVLAAGMKNASRSVAKRVLALVTGRKIS